MKFRDTADYKSALRALTPLLPLFPPVERIVTAEGNRPACHRFAAACSGREETARSPRMAAFYDTHAHLDYPDFQKDFGDVLARAQAAGITRMISIGTNF